MGFIASHCWVDQNELDSRRWQNFYLRMMKRIPSLPLAALILEMELDFKGMEEWGDHLDEQHLPVSFIIQSQCSSDWDFFTNAGHQIWNCSQWRILLIWIRNKTQDFSPLLSWATRLRTGNRTDSQLQAPWWNWVQGRTYKPPPLLSDKLLASSHLVVSQSLRRKNVALTCSRGFDFKQVTTEWMAWRAAVCIFPLVGEAWNFRSCSCWLEEGKNMTEHC